MKDARYMNRVAGVFFLGWLGWLLLPEPITEPKFWYLIPPLAVWAICTWIGRRAEIAKKEENERASARLMERIKEERKKDPVWDANMTQFEQDIEEYNEAVIRTEINLTLLQGWMDGIKKRVFNPPPEG